MMHHKEEDYESEDAFSMEGDTFEDGRLCFDPSKFYGRRTELNALVSIFRELGSTTAAQPSTTKTSSSSFYSCSTTNSRQCNIVDHPNSKQEDEDSVGDREADCFHTFLPTTTSPSTKQEDATAEWYNRTETSQPKINPTRITHPQDSFLDPTSTNSAPTTSKVILVGGVPGTGKTRLIQQFLNEIDELALEGTLTRFHVVTGKYQELQGADPLSALMEAFSNFLQKVQSGIDPREQERLQETLQTALGKNQMEQHSSNVLMELLPRLRDFLGPPSSSSSSPVLATPTTTSTAATTSTSLKEKSDSSFPIKVEVDYNSTTQVEEDGQSNTDDDEEEEDAASISTTSSPNQRLDYEQSLHRLKYIFQQFVKAICTAQRPMILFLDDLQWADPLSMELLSSLVLDRTLQHFLLVGVFRSKSDDDDDEEEDDDKEEEKAGTATAKAAVSSCCDDEACCRSQVHHHRHQRVPMSAWMESILQQQPDHKIYQIHLDNHDQDGMDEFVADTLELEVEQVRRLSQFLFQKTKGNMFFAIQALKELERKHILSFSFATCQWEWDETGIESGWALTCLISDNVRDVIVGKLQSFPPMLQTALTVAAFMRSSFDVASLQGFLNDEGGAMLCGSVSIERVELMELLDLAVVEGVLQNSIGSDIYTFSHDPIQAAAYSLVTDEERDMLRLQVGKFLVTKASSGGGPPWMWFVAADHLNSIPANETKPLETARLNLEVGKKAMLLCAFSAASDYFLKGIEAMKRIDKPWKLHYTMTYTLYKESAVARNVIGDYDLCFAHCQEILSHATTLSDKVPAYMCLDESLSRQDRHEEAMRLCISVLQMLKAYPKRFQMVQLIRDFVLVKKLFRQFANAAILKLPILKDKSALYAMELLTRLATRAVLCDNSFVFMLTTLHQIIYSFRHGLCDATAIAMAYYGMILCGPMGQRDLGQRMGLLAKEVQKLCNSRRVETAVLLVAGLYIDCWSVPLTECMETLQLGCQSGMESGCMDAGGWNWVGSNITAYQAGFPLKTVLETGNVLLDHLERYKITSCISDCYPIIEYYQYLMGIKKPDWSKINEIKLQSADESVRSTYALVTRAFLAYYFGHLEIAELALKKNDKKKGGAGDLTYFGMSTALFLKGVVASALGRTTRCRKYKWQARGAMKKMYDSVTTGCLNDLPKAYIMDAEYHASFDGKKRDRVQTKFDLAISVSKKAGFVQDAALANELAGEYFLRINDGHWSSVYLTQAHRLYKEWGAHAKVSHLLEHRGPYLDHAAAESKSAISIVKSENYTLWSKSSDFMEHKVDMGQLWRKLLPTSYKTHDGDMVHEEQPR
jgi:predicted ATPase